MTTPTENTVPGASRAPRVAIGARSRCAVAASLASLSARCARFVAKIAADFLKLEPVPMRPTSGGGVTVLGGHFLSRFSAGVGR